MIAVTTSSEFDAPYGVAVDGSGNVFIADFYNSVVERVTPGPAHSSPDLLLCRARKWTIG
jgi:streptogramin lyase